MKYEKELPQRHFDVFGFVLRRLEVEKLSSKNSEISTPKVPTTFLPRVPRTFLQTPIDVCQIGFCYPRFSEAKLLSPILNTIVIIIFKPLWRVYWYFFGESYSIIPLYYVVLLHQLTFLHHPFSLLVMISALIEIPTMIMITVVVRGQPAIFDMSM